jgi:hypothetical protein
MKRKYEKCSFENENNCEDCWKQYYGSYSDPRFLGSDLVGVRNKLLNKMIEDMRKDAERKEILREYLKKAEKIVTDVLV